MAARHRAVKKVSRKRSGAKGPHATARTSDGYKWLGAGAITLGVGAALMGGAGVAYADDGATKNSPHAQQASAGDDSQPDARKRSKKAPHTTKSPGGETPTGAAQNGTATTSTGDVGAGPRKATTLTTPATISASAPKPTASVAAARAAELTPDPTTGVHSSQSPTSAPMVSPTGIAPAAPPPMSAATTGTVVGVPTRGTPPSAADAIAAAVLVGSATTAESVPSSVTASITPKAKPMVTALTASTAPAAVASSTTTSAPNGGLATAEAVDPRQAYLQQFRDADPTDQFYTPASPEYQPAPSDGPTVSVADAVAIYGSNGFSHTSDGSLKYTNTTTTKVAIEYGADYSKEPVGIRVVDPGQSVTLPGGNATFALAQGPKANAPEGFTTKVLAIGGPGYPPASSTGGSTDSPWSNVSIPDFQSHVQSLLGSIGGVLDSTAFALIRDTVDFGLNHLVPLVNQAAQDAAKKAFDGLSSVQKSLVIGNYAEAATHARTTLTDVLHIVTGAFNKANAALSVYAVYEAYQTSEAAHTEMEKVHAGVETVAAEAPFAGAAIGFAVAGPAGAAVGFAVGGAFGLGLSIGNGVTKLFGW